MFDGIFIIGERSFTVNQIPVDKWIINSFRVHFVLVEFTHARNKINSARKFSAIIKADK